MLRPGIEKALLALIAAMFAACAPGARSACSGMVYEEFGLKRAQFRPCAAEMVKQLGRAQNAPEVMADQSHPKAARTKARQKCLSAISALTRLLRAAAASTKLLARWDDARLNDFSWSVVAAREYYKMVCYYGAKPFEQAGMVETSPSGNSVCVSSL